MNVKISITMYVDTKQAKDTPPRLRLSIYLQRFNYLRRAFLFFSFLLLSFVLEKRKGGR